MSVLINTRTLIAGIAGLVVGQCFYYYPALPMRIASHFDWNGVANGWMEKDTYFIVYAVMLLVTGGIFGGVGALMTKLPADMINLPNKDYWLAPERAAKTKAVLSEQMDWFSTATLILLVVVNQLVFQANMAPTPHLDNRAQYLIFVYLIYTAFWTFNLIRRFSCQK